MRKNKKTLYNDSLERDIEVKNNNKLKLKNTIQDPNSDFTSIYENREI